MSSPVTPHPRPEIRRPCRTPCEGEARVPQSPSLRCGEWGYDDSASLPDAHPTRTSLRPPPAHTQLPHLSSRNTPYLHTDHHLPYYTPPPTPDPRPDISPTATYYHPSPAGASGVLTSPQASHGVPTSTIARRACGVRRTIVTPFAEAQRRRLGYTHPRSRRPARTPKR